MDDKSTSYITPHYNSCDDLIMYNWVKLNKSNPKNLQWLVIGYDGFNDLEVSGVDLEKIYKSITDEREERNRDNASEDYYELVSDLNYQVQRYTTVTMLLSNIEKYPHKPKEIYDGYVNELMAWRFYIKTDKPLKDELKRLSLQLNSVKMKIKQMISDKEKVEASLKDRSSSIYNLKQQVQKIRGGNIDFKAITLSEWDYMLEDIRNAK